MRSVEDTGNAALVAAVSLARREAEEAIVEAVTAARREARADKEQALAQQKDSLVLEARAALDALLAGGRVGDESGARPSSKLSGATSPEGH